MTWDALQHPRATDGTFSEKTGAAPEVSLSLPAPPTPNIEPEDTLDELFNQIVWRPDGTFVGTLDDRAYAVRVNPDGVYVVDESGRLLDTDEPMHQAVSISVGRFDNEKPVPPAPVRLEMANGDATELGALYDGWQRADVVAGRVQNRIEEAVASGDLPPFEYEVRSENAGKANQRVELRILASEEQLHSGDEWTLEASVAYHGASHILDAWNRKAEGGLTEPGRMYHSAVYIHSPGESAE